MKRILYSLCAGCMVLALTATGAPVNKADSKKKGRGKASAQVASPAKGKAAIKGGGQARVQRSVARPRVTSKATSNRGSVRTDRGRAIRKPSVASRSKTPTSRDVVTRSKGRASREGATKSAGRTSRETARTRSARAAERATTTRTLAGKAAPNREKALARESTLRSPRLEAARTRTAQTAVARTRVAARSNLAVKRERNLTFARNVAVNRDPNVRIVNNWRNDRFRGANYGAFYNYNRHWHDRSWWRNNYSNIVFVLGGWWYWNAGYWYPALGYAPYANYIYDGPIYGYGNLTPDQIVVNVQVALQQQGYYAGPIDGILGPETRGGLAAFQADYGLAITSTVDQPTLATLGLA
jgi:hypothetical protein